jgi:hypothetical protein
MQLTLSEISALSILIAAIIGIVRFRDAASNFRPFIYLIWAGALNEVLSVALLSAGLHTAVNNNIYVLAEALLILWFIKKTDVFTSSALFTVLAISFLLFWVVENIFITGIGRISSYFRIYYSFVVVMLSISVVNHVLITVRENPLHMPLFLICLGFIIFFTYKILVETFWVYGLNDSKDFRSNVYTILLYLNLFVNLLFALAMLWIPKKREYIQLS